LNIFLDLSYFPDTLLPIILKSNNLNNFIIKKKLSNSDRSIINSKGILLNYPGSINDLENLLNSILQEKSIKEYVAVQDTEQENTLTLLKDGDVEQLGIYICDLCGAVFHDEEEKYVHQRAHFIF
jgi:hypothetical protein